jgi:hypothetical protein
MNKGRNGCQPFRPSSHGEIFNMRNLNRDFALRLAEVGIEVFPCGQDKKPLVKWRRFSSCDPEIVAQWWFKYPAALPGIDLAKAGLLVLDADRHGDAPDGRTALRELLQRQTGYDWRKTPTAFTPGDGTHVYFRQNGHEYGNATGNLPDGIDVRGYGGYVVCPYAVLADGKRYQPVPGTADLIASFRAGVIPDIPQGIITLLEAQPKEKARRSQANSGVNGDREQAYAQAALKGCMKELADTGNGCRNETLNAIAYRLGRMVARGWVARAAVEAALIGAMHVNGNIVDDGIEAVNATLASGLDAGMAEPHPDLADREKEQPEEQSKAAQGAAQDEKHGAETAAEPAQPSTLAEVIAAFDKWLVLRDHKPIYGVLGAMAANLLPGDPVWLGLIAPPSSAKTEILNALGKLQFIEAVGTLTLAALLSGTPKRQRDKAAQGGLLRKLGDFGILVLKDFGSVLSMRSDAKTEVLGALREIYDGAWTRHLGVDGGRILSWTGKIGLVFGATEAYDDHYAVIGSLGDRFLLCRLDPTYDGQLRKALYHKGSATKAMRNELAAAVAGLFTNQFAEPSPLSEGEIQRLDNVVALAVRLRAHVTRDRYSREIESIHGAEGPGRLGLCLERLFAGLVAIGVSRNQAVRIVEDIALDSAPPIRRHAFEMLTDVPATTRDIAKALGLPTVTARRILEELVANGLAVRTRDRNGQDGDEPAQEKKGGADRWALDAEWEHWPAKWAATNAAA